MTDLEAEQAKYHIYRTVRALEDARPILKNFMSSMDGVPSSGRRSLMFFTILERIYYNMLGATPLAKDMMFNQNAAVPLSQIFRSIVYEITIAYWLGEGDFDEKIAKLNGDFVKKGYAKLKADDMIPDAAALQRLFVGWQGTAPENFTADASGNFSINTTIKSITFSDICKELASVGQNPKSITAAYTVLSQQAHLSEFSRRMIYEKHTNNASLFHYITWALLKASLMLISEINLQAPALQELNKVLLLFPEHEQQHNA